MKARALIDEASLAAETMKAMGEAFDQAWARIAPTFGNCPPQVETGSQMFAEMMLSVATEGDTNLEDVHDRANIAMATHYSSCIRRE